MRFALTSAIIAAALLVTAPTRATTIITKTISANSFTFTQLPALTPDEFSRLLSVDVSGSGSFLSDPGLRLTGPGTGIYTFTGSGSDPFGSYSVLTSTPVSLLPNETVTFFQSGSGSYTRHFEGAALSMFASAIPIYISGGGTAAFAPTSGNIFVSTVQLPNQAAGGSMSARLTFTLTDAVPEPTTWALMLLGFGVIGSRLRFLRVGSDFRFLRVGGHR